MHSRVIPPTDKWTVVTYDDYHNPICQRQVDTEEEARAMAKFQWGYCKHCKEATLCKCGVCFNLDAYRMHHCPRCDRCLSDVREICSCLGVCANCGTSRMIEEDATWYEGYVYCSDECLP